MQERTTTAGIAIEQGKVFVAHRAEGGALSGKWEFPGGKQRWGESDEDTLKREYIEEFGADVEVGETVTSFDFTNKDTLYHLRAHMIRILSSQMNLSVHTEICWVTPDELMQLDMGDSDSRIRDAVAALLLNS